MLVLDVRKRSRVFTLSPARSGTCVASDITWVKSLTRAKVSASRPAGLVTLEEKLSQSEMRTLKSPRTMISERGDCKVMVSIDLEWWSKRSSLFFELVERYRVQMYIVA